jgi:PIN domain nuclease of toxin-antitoxin system
MNGFTLASEYATDTMGLVLWLEKRRMSAQAQAIFVAAEAGQTVIHIPGIVFAEVLYLSEKGRIGLSLSDVAFHMQRFSHFRECPLSQVVIETAGTISDIPELHDRLIAATARWLNVALITNDPMIQSSAFVSTVW